jgi:signal transduction histidine kinase
MPTPLNREGLLLLGGLIVIIGLAFVGSRVVRSLNHGFSIRLQLFFSIWTTSMLATGVIGMWVIDRLQARAEELALAEQTAVGVVLEIIREFGPKIALITGLLGIGAASTAYFLGRAISEPIERLTRSAEAIAHGQRQRSLPTPSGREVRRLTAAFDSMLRELEDRTYVERFVADLSHELKNPVSAIRAATEILTEGAIEDVQARDRFLSRIDEAASRLEILLNDLLMLARLEARGLGPTQAPLLLDDLIRQATHGLAADIEGKALVLDLHLQPVRISGDSQWLRRAVENLVVNGIRYSPMGGTIRISSTLKDGLVWIQVLDQGPGVAEHIRGQVFERFVTDKRNPNQTGLGLAIVRSVAELHGGTARLVEHESGGACFELSIKATS